MLTHSDFPADIAKRAYTIKPRAGVVIVDGFKRFRLSDLNNIRLDDRLMFPHDLFVAIHKAGTAGRLHSPAE